MGQSVAEKMAKDPAITEITIAGRNSEKAKRTASAIGEKANSMKADVMDEGEIARTAADSDAFVNTSGPDYVVQLPAVRAAIKAGVNYCDVSCDGPAAETVLMLDAKAKDAGISVIIGIGWTPGLDNLLMAHMVRQLDETEVVQTCLVWPVTDVVKGDSKKVAEELRNSGPFSASWETGMRCFSGQCKIYGNGKWVVVDPFENAVTLPDPYGGLVTAYPACGAEPITIPRYVRGVKSVSVLLSFCPFPLNELARQLAVRIRSGEMSTKEAALAFIETAGADRERWLAGSEKVTEEWPFWIVAQGLKDGSRVRYTLNVSPDWPSTGGPLYTAAKMLLEGRIKERGILPPEACLDPLPFMEEVASIVPGRPMAKKLFDESIERLD